MENRIKCNFCDKPALKTNSNSEYVCEKRALYGDCKGLPQLTKQHNQSNNDLCFCKSGKKYKKCCKV